VAEVQRNKGLFFALLILVKTDALALIKAVSFYGGVHHKRIQADSRYQLLKKLKT